MKLTDCEGWRVSQFGRGVLGIGDAEPMFMGSLDLRFDAHWDHEPTLGRDRPFHRWAGTRSPASELCVREIPDAVERVPTGFMEGIVLPDWHALTILRFSVRRSMGFTRLPCRPCRNS